MNFIAQVEEQLRDLGSEARKKHPGVKEASERAILTLRSLQSQYVSAVRASSSTSKTPHPTTSLFRSQDVLRPFLLACNYPDASPRLLSIGLNAIQLLIDGDAICPDDSVHIARVLAIQANCCFEGGGGGAGGGGQGGGGASPSAASEKESHKGGGVMSAIAAGYSSSVSGSRPHNRSDREQIAMKVLQTLAMVIESRSLELSEEVLSQALTVCFVTIAGHPPGSGGEGGGSGRERHGPKLKITRGISGDKGGSGGSGEGGVGKMRKMAIGTLRRIVAVTFERAASDGTDGGVVGSPNMEATRMAAAKAFADLCALAQKDHPKRAGKGEEGKAVETTPVANGPLTMGLAGGGQISRIGKIPPPPRSTCFELLEMIISRTPSLFIEKSTNDSAETDDNDDKSLSFPHLLKSTLCPLVASYLLSESTSPTSPTDDVARHLNLPGPTFPSLGFSNEKETSSKKSDDGLNFLLLIRSVQLASTIISQFGPTLKNECHVLVMALVRFVSRSTEAYRDVDNFEDGYIYTTAAAIENEPTVQQPSGWRVSLSADSNPTTPSVSSKLIPNYTLWRSAVALDALHHLLTNDRDTIRRLNTVESGDATTHQSTIIAVIAESVSDFATIASSQKKSILAVVGAVDERGGGEEAFEPRVLARAVAIGKVFDDWDSGDGGLSGKQSSGSTNGGFLQPVASSSSSSPPPCDEGEAIWVAFNCTLSLSSSLSSLISSTPAPSPELSSLVNACFAPSLAVMQHFLKRYPGDKRIMRAALRGYETLADAVFPCCEDGDIKRKAVLTSLCKLSLPGWGKGKATDPSCQLKDHNVEALSSLFHIVHSNHNHIHSSWQYVLSLLEQLSPLSIASSKLSDDSYKTALALSEMFTRLSSFTTCLSSESLEDYIKALIGLSQNALNGSKGETSVGPTSGESNSEPEDTVLVEDSATSHANTRDSREPPAHRESFGGKLLTFAGRAFNVGSVYENDSYDDSQTTAIRRVPSSKSYSEDFRQDVFRHLAATKPTTRKDVFRSLPLSLVVLTDITLVNGFRFGVYGKVVTAHLCDLVGSLESSDGRSFAMDILSNLITSRLSGGSSVASSLPFQTELTVAKPLPLTPEDYLKTDSPSSSLPSSSPEDDTKPLPTPLTQAELLTPLCQTITLASRSDTAEAGINALHVILEGAGHNLTGSAWPILIDAISALTGDPSVSTPNTDRSTSQWATCSTLAFRCLKLIVDDFLDQLPVPPDVHSSSTRQALLSCCASFGSSRHDVNTSLTATGMLWTIADQDPTPESLDHVLSKLAFLSCDERAEVRNCSVNTLFSCVVGIGHRFSAAQWRACLVGTIFGVLDQVASQKGENFGGVASTAPGGWKSKKKDNGEKRTEGEGGDNAPAGATTAGRYRVTVHHSRDSAGKQWATTQVLTFRGLERVLRQFFGKLLESTLEDDDDDDDDERRDETTPWFESAWSRIVEEAFRCATLTGGRDTLDLRQAGIDILVLCTQLSCRAGIVAAATQVRVGTNMRVINGALRSVDGSGTTSSLNNKNEVLDQDSQRKMTLRRECLFRMAFGVLERFTFKLIDGTLQEDEEDSHMFIERTMLQVLTKLSHGLSKLYECCKEYELSPQPLRRSTLAMPTPTQVNVSDENPEEEENYEGRFVQMMYAVTISAMPDPGARYLTQAQRTSLDLLKKMATKGSCRGFEKLACMGGKSFVCKYVHSADDDDELSVQGDVVAELVEFEAAKAVADAFTKDGVPHTTKVSVLSIILETFIDGQNSKTTKKSSSLDELDEDEKIGDTQNESTNSEDIKTNVCYDLLVPVIIGGLDSASYLEKKTVGSSSKPKEKNEDNEDVRALLETVWSRLVVTLSVLLKPIKTPYCITFTPHTSKILEILACIISRSPSRIYPELGVELSQGANTAIEVAKDFEESPNTPSRSLLPTRIPFRRESNKRIIKPEDEKPPAEHCLDALKIFHACFVGLSQCQPKSAALQSIAEVALSDALEVPDSRSMRLRQESSVIDFKKPLSLYQDESEKKIKPGAGGDMEDIDVDMEVAVIVCDVLTARGRYLIDIAVKIFPLLCQLTNTSHGMLRRKAGAVLACVDLGEIIDRAEANGRRVVEVEKENEDLKKEVERLKGKVQELEEKLGIE